MELRVRIRGQLAYSGQSPGTKYQKPCHTGEDILKTYVSKRLHPIHCPSHLMFHSCVDTELSHSLPGSLFGTVRASHSVELYLLQGVIISLVPFSAFKRLLQLEHSCASVHLLDTVSCIVRHCFAGVSWPVDGIDELIEVPLLVFSHTSESNERSRAINSIVPR
jgi:hypothetical protein